MQIMQALDLIRELDQELTRHIKGSRIVREGLIKTQGIFHQALTFDLLEDLKRDGLREMCPT